MMDIGKDLQDAYECGRQDAWDIAQKVFGSTVTLYEAEDVAKQIAKTEPQRDCKECKYAWWNNDMKRYECSISRCPYNEQTENSSEKPNNCEEGE